jgi:hypothetical protein
MKITFKTTSLLAALECSAKKDLRYYLQGINIQIKKIGVGMVYGTDGHMLFAGQLPYDGDYVAELNLIIPTDAVKRLDKKLDFTELEFDGQNYLLGGARFAPIDSTYPDIARVIPDIQYNIEQTPGSFDPALLVRARAALALYLGTKPKDVFGFIQRGSESAVMHAGTNECLVVVMPMRATNEAPYAGFNRSYM